MPDLLSILWWRKFYMRAGRTLNWGCLLIFGVPLVIGFGWNQYGGTRSQNRSGDENGVIATVNREPVTRAQYRAALPRSGGGGEQAAKDYGGAVNRVVAAIVIRQLAKKYGVQVSDTDVDRSIADERTKAIGKNGTDAQWEEYVSLAHNGMTPTEYHDSLTHDSSLLGQALMDKFKSMEQVTPEDVKNYNAEVQARVLQIGYGKPAFSDPKKPQPFLTEEQAKKKADDLLAQARSGANFPALVKANSTDFSKSQGGDLGFMPEFRKMPDQMSGGPGQEMLASSYGQEFADAIHKTPAGQFTPVVKTSSFGSNGFAFARVEARRDSAPAKPDPKNPAAAPPVTDPKKITEELKQERASQKLGDEFKKEFKAAKVDFKPEGAVEQAYYDYTKAQQDQAQADQARMMAQFGRPSTDPVPSAADIAAEKARADAEILEQARKHPDDSTLALIAARSLKTRLDLAPPDQQSKLRDDLIALDQSALKSTEDRSIRFDLAQLYRDKGDMANAEAVYQKISRLLDIAPGVDTASLSEELAARKRLVSGFRAINKPDLAASEQSKIARVESRLADERMKAALKQQSGGASIPPGGTGSQSLTLPSSGGPR